MGTASPGSPPSRVPAGGSRCWYVAHMLYLTYINTLLLVRSEHVAAETCKIKIEKSATPAGRQPRSIPLNTARNGRDLDWQCLIFERIIASSPRA